MDFFIESTFLQDQLMRERQWAARNIIFGECSARRVLPESFSQAWDHFFDNGTSVKSERSPAPSTELCASLKAYISKVGLKIC